MDVKEIRKKLFEYIKEAALNLIEEDAEAPVKQFEVLREITPGFNNIFDKEYVKEYEEEEKKKAVGFYLLTVNEERMCEELGFKNMDAYNASVFRHDKILNENFEYLYDIYDILPEEYISDIIKEEE